MAPDTLVAEGPGTRAWTLVGVFLVAIVKVVGLALVFASTSTQSPQDWGMMGGWGGGWAWMWGLGALMMVVPLVLLFAFLYLLLRMPQVPPVVVSTSASPSPETEAGLRYSRGEISAEHHRRILQDLRGG